MYGLLTGCLVKFTVLPRITSHILIDYITLGLGVVMSGGMMFGKHHRDLEDPSFGEMM